MATLTKSKPTKTYSPQEDAFLTSGIPTPFPREQLVPDFQSRQGTESIDSEAFTTSENEAGPSISVEQAPKSSETVALKDVMPSILYVQKSCLMTLNNLLSGPVGWHPIIPDRRHSMPSSQSAAASSEDASSTSALQTLVTNLRNHGGDEEMIEARDTGSDSDLIHELRIRVDSVAATSLSSSDAGLAKALVSLLSDLNRLAQIQANISHLPSPGLDVETSSILDAPPPIDVFDTLSRQLSDLQIERLSSQTQLLAPGASPLVAVETALLWSRIDTELENVVAMCRQRTDALPRFPYDHLPPQYDVADYDMDTPPDYDGQGRRQSIDDYKSKANHPQQINGSRQADEKMRLDFEAVTMAIDRLYRVAPQLHNQRVELKSTKLAQMEQARQAGVDTAPRQKESTKGKERDFRELEQLLDLIGKASERTLKDQSVVLDGSMQTRLEKAQRRESAKRDAFVEQLVLHSQAGRIHGQDAVLQARVKDPEALLSLPEFMRELPPPRVLQREKEATDLLTLPEFVRESIPANVSQPQLYEPEPVSAVKMKEKRHRSLSAPPLAWLRSSSSRGSSSSNTSTANGVKPKSKVADSHGFDVVYVAENHENLHHTLVFATITGGKAGSEVQAEVLPPYLGNICDGSDHLVIKSGPHSSFPLMLPAHTNPGPRDVQAQGSHYEIKLMNNRPSSSSSPSSAHTSDNEDDGPPPLLDAAQLTNIKPSSFLCASCSLPLIQSSRVSQYRDLPSEHWEELVEAWMCHADQKLSEQVAKQGQSGFWPVPGQGLVGGSYILFEESAMNNNNLHITKEARLEDNWKLTRCLCGAIVGRCRSQSLDEGTTTAFRVLKYAVRPVSQTAEPLKIPLSAFIVQDMTEYVQAHASYRFVIQDEEEERPRILIWLFKPKMRLAYTAPSSRAIPKSANIIAAKVLYKLLKPSDQVTDIKSLLNKYPGFPQAEFLSYPMPICRRLAALLRESNSAYPPNLRTMIGLEVGWLQRV